MGYNKSLIDRFLEQELNSKVRSVLKDALDERARSESVLFRGFEFNCFDVSFDFQKGIVILQDALSAGDGSSVDIPISEFVSACGLSLS